MCQRQRKTDVCPTCNSLVVGRSDKVFCSIECKNKHHKIARVLTEKFAYNVNKRIKRNYTVLLGLFGLNAKRICIHRDMLFQHGFDINACEKIKINGKLKTFKIKEFSFHLQEDGVVEIWRTIKKGTLFKEFLARWSIEFPDGIGLGIFKINRGLVRFYKIISLDIREILTAKSFINSRDT